MSAERACMFKANAAAFGITLSIHGPYYISLGTSDPQKNQTSLAELTKCVSLAKQLGSTRVVFHPGAVPQDRSSSGAIFSGSL